MANGRFVGLGKGNREWVPSETWRTILNEKGKGTPLRRVRKDEELKTRLELVSEGRPG